MNLLLNFFPKNQHEFMAKQSFSRQLSYLVLDLAWKAEDKVKEMYKTYREYVKMRTDETMTYIQDEEFIGEGLVYFLPDFKPKYGSDLGAFVRVHKIEGDRMIIGAFCTYYNDSNTNYSRNPVTLDYFDDMRHVEVYTLNTIPGVFHDGIGWRVPDGKR